MQFILDRSAAAQRAFFDQMPPVLFKYRCWSDTFHQRILRDRELFLSSPARFNDPFDLGLPFKQHPDDLDPIRIKNKLEASAAARFPELRGQSELLEAECARQLLLIQQSPAEWFQENWGFRPEELNRLFGVLSLTPHFDNFLMWSHYSNNHKGFCVGFDTESLVRAANCAFGPVQYTEDIPFISYDDSQYTLMNKLIYTKSKIWEYEDEYRISGIYRADNLFGFNPEVIRVIYLGVKMSYEARMEIIELVGQRYPHVQIWDMQLHGEQFRLQPSRVF